MHEGLHVSPLTSTATDLFRGHILETERIHVSTLEAWRGRVRLSCAAPERGDALALEPPTVVASSFARSVRTSSFFKAEVAKVTELLAQSELAKLVVQGM